MNRSTKVITNKNYKFETSIMTSILFDVEYFEGTETKNTIKTHKQRNSK